MLEWVFALHKVHTK